MRRWRIRICARSANNVRVSFTFLCELHQNFLSSRHSCDDFNYGRMIHCWSCLKNHSNWRNTFPCISNVSSVQVIDQGIMESLRMPEPLSVFGPTNWTDGEVRVANHMASVGMCMRLIGIAVQGGILRSKLLAEGRRCWRGKPFPVGERFQIRNILIYWLHS